MMCSFSLALVGFSLFWLQQFQYVYLDVLCIYLPCLGFASVDCHFSPTWEICDHLSSTYCFLLGSPSCHTVVYSPFCTLTAAETLSLSSAVLEFWQGSQVLLTSDTCPVVAPPTPTCGLQVLQVRHEPLPPGASVRVSAWVPVPQEEGGK